MNAYTAREAVLTAAHEEFGVSPKDILSKTRIQHIAHARQMAMHAYKALHPTASLTAIGCDFDRDHTTVLHALEAVKRRADADPELRARLERMTDAACERYNPRPVFVAQGNPMFKSYRGKK